MSISISNSDLQSVVGYLDSFIAIGGSKDNLKQYNYIRRAQLLRNKLKRKLSSS